MSARFRKRPAEIDAWQWKGEKFPTLPDWATKAEYQPTMHLIYISTLEGVMSARPNDWIIRGVKGEIYPCKPDIFEATYEPV